MRIAESILRLCEARENYYHGTSSLNVRKILKTGFDTIQKRNKYWAEGEVRGDSEVGGLASHEGNYFSQNLMTAIGSAGATTRHFGGVEALFEVRLETRQAMFDEDNLPNPKYLIFNAYNTVYPDYSLTDWSIRSLAKNIEEGDRESIDILDKVKDSAVGLWITDLQKKIKQREGNTHVLGDKELKRLRPAVEAFVEAAWGLLVEHGEKAMTSGRVSSKEYRKAEESILKTMKGYPSRFLTKDFSRNAQMTDPVAFSGSSKILAAVILPFEIPYTKYNDQMEASRKLPSEVRCGWYIVYGNPSEKFHEEFSQRMTDKFKIWRGSLKDIYRLYEKYEIPMENIV